MTNASPVVLLLWRQCSACSKVGLRWAPWAFWYKMPAPFEGERVCRECGRWMSRQIWWRRVVERIK